jgi:DNA-binding transcriptional MerR regulator
VKRKRGGSTGLRMNELMAATGLPKSTLAHYLKEGLLPAPAKSSRNMAYYPRESVERVRLIRALQAQSVPLARIRQYLELGERGYDPTVLVRINELVFGRAEGEALDREAYLSATGLRAEQFEELARVRLLLPRTAGGFDPQDVALGRIYARMLGLGITAADLAFYGEHAEAIVEREMDLRMRVTLAMEFGDDAAATARMVEAARAIRTYVIDRTFQHRVAASQERKVEQLLSGPRRAVPCM